jgi:hypothetical protein
MSNPSDDDDSLKPKTATWWYVKWITISTLSILYFLSPVIDLYLSKRWNCESMIIQDPTYFFYPILYTVNKSNFVLGIHFLLIPEVEDKKLYIENITDYTYTHQFVGHFTGASSVEFLNHP